MAPIIGPRRRTARPLTFRPEIEGLRAVAVILVILDHLTNRPKGGFIGVDVFFVISGFLITGLLVKEHDEAGHISIRGFYVRRVRRILPAALTVLAATWIASDLAFYAQRAKDAHTDILWSAGFLANVHFSTTGTDYFNADKPPSPVQHFWSLSVEEQFYIVWPILLVLLLLLAHKFFLGRSRTALLGFSSALVVALFAVSMVQTRSNAATAYFATTARVWELGVGAVLAIAAPLLAQAPRWTRSIALPLGLTAIIGSAFVISASARFPAPAAGVPVLGAALVLYASGSARSLPLSWLLTNPAARYVGRVSYSLYLWHWPVIIILGAMLADSSTSFKPVAILAMATLTVASYHFVEQPFRTMTWRIPTASRRPARRPPTWRQSPFRRRRSEATGSRTHIKALVAVITLAELTALAWYLRPGEAHKDFINDANASATLPGADTRPIGQIAAPVSLATAIDTALSTQKWPTLNPGVGSLDSAKAPEWQPCGNVEAKEIARCTFSSGGPVTAAKTAVVIGDSIALSWMPAIRAALEPTGWTVIALTYGQCPAVPIDVNQQVGEASSFTAACNAHRSWAVTQVARIKPGVVIISSAENSLTRLKDGSIGTKADAEWQVATTSMINSLTRAGARRVVVMAPPPAGENLTKCDIRSSLPDDCVSTLDSIWPGMTAAERAAVVGVGPTASYLDTLRLFCSIGGYCPSFVGSTPVRVDGDHLTADYSRQLGPFIRGALLTP